MGCSGLEGSSKADVDCIDRNRLKGLNWTEVEQMDRIGLNWTKMDRNVVFIDLEYHVNC